MEVVEKSQTIDPEVRAYVYSLVNAVGGQSTVDERYAVGDDAAAVLNDLSRWLRLYDDKLDRFDVKRCLAEANLVKGDLLEILALWPEDGQDHILKSRLALACLQLLVPLTWPIELDENKTTVNHLRHTPFLQLAQVGYKRAILHFEDAQILRTVVRSGLPSMAVPRRDRNRRDESIIRIILYFFRNLAMIAQPQHLPSQGDENEISRSTTIDKFHEQDVLSLLLTIGSGSSDDFQEHDVVVLEILFHLLKGVDAKKLFMEKEQLSNEETGELEMLMQKEKNMHKGYNKHAPTRHNRFGTMIWVKREDERLSTVTGQNTITNESTTLQQMDSSKKWNRPKYRGKAAQDAMDNSDLSAHVDLTDGARKRLRGFIEDFLDSSFNPLFGSLRKAIERGTDRVQPTHNKQYFYLVSWFLAAEAARKEQAKQLRLSRTADQPCSNSEDNSFAYIAAVLDQETFVLLNRHMQRALDEKNWQDLQATLLCFTRILLIVQDMAESLDEEDQEIAENIQNRIFYEESTHDHMVQILRGYSNQGFAYLDAVTESVHVFVRMLERYSKQNVDLQIRSKRRAKKKKATKQKSQLGVEAGGEDANPDESDGADEHEAHLVTRERKFDFARFSSKFLSQPCVNTFVSLMHFYADLSPSQLKRCHRFLYRLAFKNELAVLLFRVDILQLLLKMIKGPEGLSTESEGFKDWEQLVQQIFRRCIKWIERQSEGEGWKDTAVVEMLFSKIPNTLFYLQNGFERAIEKRAPRPPAEMEIKASVEQEQRVPVAVTMMIEQGKQDAVEWVKRELKRASEERQAWEDGQAATSAMLAGTANLDERPESIERPSAPSIPLAADSDDRRSALFKDKYLRLLLTTLGIERLGAAEDPNASWIVPESLSASQLNDTIASIQQTEFDAPTFEHGKAAIDLVRNKSTARNAAAFSDDESGADNASDGDVNEAMFPQNLRQKARKDGDETLPRKKRRIVRGSKDALTEEEIEARAAARARKEKERNSKIKSALFVTDSDDETDDDADAEFFKAEEERRKKTAEAMRTQLLEEARRANRRKRKVSRPVAAEDGPKRRRTALGNPDNNNASDMPLHHYPMDAAFALASDDSDQEDRVASSAGSISDDEGLHTFRVSEDEGRDDETPSTSPTALGKAAVLTEVSGNVGMADNGTGKGGTGAPESELEEDDEMPVARPRAGRRRAGFIVDSDSE